jgi:DNA-binding MarR family transcriptional regulator
MELAEQLPSYPLETPTTDQIRTLEYIETADTEATTPNKSELIAFAEQADLSFLTGADPSNEKAKFALLNNRIVDPLLEDGYIQVESAGRTKRISLTDTGKNALRAFRHELPE